MRILILYLLSIICFNNAIAQKPIVTNKTEVISLNKSFIYGDLELKITSISEDSRCPKEVMCIRAGEVFVTIEVYKSAIKISEKLLKFTPAMYSPEFMKYLYDSEIVKIKALELNPYPKVSTPIIKKDYKLKISVEEFN